MGEGRSAMQGHSVNVFKKTLAYEDDLLLSSHMPFLLYIFSP